jgi:crotonobetainyl-CoA:carnitine CoA-transferase CaiB-like acyl-CoA transferase
MDSPSWASDPALSSVEGRRGRHDEIDASLGAWTSTRSRHDVARLCQEHGVPAGPMMTSLDMLHDAHYVARGFPVEIDQPGVGSIALEGGAFEGTAMVGPDIRPAPGLGQHTYEVCRTLLGMTDADVDRLIAAGVLEGPL